MSKSAVFPKDQKSRVQPSKVQMSKSQLFRYRSTCRLITTTKENARGQVQKHIAYLSNCPIQGYVLERLPSSNSTTLGALAEFLSIIYAYWRVPVYERRQPKNIIPVRNYLALEAPSDCQKQSEKLCWDVSPSLHRSTLGQKFNFWTKIAKILMLIKTYLNFGAKSQA